MVYHADSLCMSIGAAQIFRYSSGHGRESEIRAAVHVRFEPLDEPVIDPAMKQARPRPRGSPAQG